MFYSFERTQHVFFLSNYFLTSKQKKLIYSLAKKQKGKQFAFKIEGLLQSWGKIYFILFQKVHFFCLRLIKMKVFHFTIVDVFFCCFFASANLIITDPKNYFHDLRTFVHSTMPSTFSHLNFSVANHSNEERQTKLEKILH